MKQEHIQPTPDINSQTAAKMKFLLVVPLAIGKVVPVLN
jgi:hypothetical protein